MKPFNIEILIDTLNELINTNSNNVRENIINLLDNFYFNKSNIGYSYLIDCLEICIINKIFFNRIIKTLRNIRILRQQTMKQKIIISSSSVFRNTLR